MEDTPERQTKNVPVGIELLRSRRGTDFTPLFYKSSVLAITFVAYAAYHATRKPISIVKAILHPELVSLSSPSPAPSISPSSQAPNPSQGWEPFVGKRGKAQLGLVDLSFLASYAFGMYFAGHLGDRLNLRHFLSAGMVGSAIFSCLLGAAYWWNVHSLSYFIFVQIIAGAFQATGWPSVVTVVANWFDKRKRGLIMGIWNCHTSVGNIVGSLLAADVLRYGWGWSFVAPGIFMGLGACLVFMFLVVEPREVDIPSELRASGASSSLAGASGDSELIMLRQPNDKVNPLPQVEINMDGEEFKEVSLTTDSRNEMAIGFLDAWMIPGVAQFALCLFFSKLVAYTFLYWLPFYIRHTKIAGDYLSDGMAGKLSTLFDVGGMAGGVVAGYVSDHFNAKATTAATFLFIAIPALVLYRLYASVSLMGNILLMMFLGMFINGPYALITTAVSADLGTHSSLNGNSKALATVTAIIDGTGSVGAAIGPLLTGFIAEQGWDVVFGMLIVSVLVAGLLLSKLLFQEMKERNFSRSNKTPFQRISEETHPFTGV